MDLWLFGIPSINSITSFKECYNHPSYPPWNENRKFTPENWFLEAKKSEILLGMIRHLLQRKKNSLPIRFRKGTAKTHLQQKEARGLGVFVQPFFLSTATKGNGDSWWGVSRAPYPSDSQRSPPNCDHWLVPSPAVIPWNFGAPAARWEGKKRHQKFEFYMYIYDEKIWKTQTKSLRFCEFRSFLRIYDESWWMMMDILMNIWWIYDESWCFFFSFWGWISSQNYWWKWTNPGQDIAIVSQRLCWMVSSKTSTVRTTGDSKSQQISFQNKTSTSCPPSHAKFQKDSQELSATSLKKRS